MPRIDLNEYVPLIFVFASGLGFSIQGLIQKLLSEGGFHDTFDSVFMKGFMQAMIAGAFVYYDDDRRIYSKPILGDNINVKTVVVLRALFGFLTIAFTLLTVDELPLGDATILIMLGPFFASIFSFIFLREPWLYPEMAACFIALSGVCFVARPPFLFGSSSSEEYGYIGYVYGLLSGVFGGLSFMTIRMLGTSAKLNWKNVCFVQGVAQTVLAIPSIFISKQGYGFALTSREYGLITLSGSIAACAQLCMTIGLQQVKSATGTSVRMSEIIGSFVLQILFTKDTVNGFSVVGAILVLISIAIVVLFKRSDADMVSSTTEWNCCNHFELPSFNTSSEGFRLVKPSGFSRSVLMNRSKPQAPDTADYVNVPLFDMQDTIVKSSSHTDPNSSSPTNANATNNVLLGPFFYSYEG